MRGTCSLLGRTGVSSSKESESDIKLIIGAHQLISLDCFQPDISIIIMPKQISLIRTTEALDVPSKRNWHTITVVLIIIIGSFVCKQAVDASSRWDNEAIRMDNNIKLSSAACLKEYNEKLCNTNSAPEKCGELVKCIQQKPAFSYSRMIELFVEEISGDIQIPAIVLALSMLWKLMEASLAKKPD